MLFNGFWYNRISISYETLADSGIEIVKLKVYYVEQVTVAEEVLTGPSSISLKNYSQPEVIPIDDSDQNYLLKNSQVEFNFTVVNPSKFAELAKICQVSDYNDIDNIPNDNKSISEFEKRSTCQPLLQQPNKFEIKHTGYYWYVVSTPIAPEGVNVRTSYEYRLRKLYYNRTMLKSPHECTADKHDECVIDSVFAQRSTKHVLAVITEDDPTNPYRVTVSKKYAVGIALVVFVSFLTLISVIFLVCLFFVCKYTH